MSEENIVHRLCLVDDGYRDFRKARNRAGRAIRKAGVTEADLEPRLKEIDRAGHELAYRLVKLFEALRPKPWNE
jgi:hypothetical protein